MTANSLCVLFLFLWKFPMCRQCILTISPHWPPPSSLCPHHISLSTSVLISLFKNKPMSTVSSAHIHLGGEAILGAWATYQWPHPKEKWLSTFLKSPTVKSSYFSCGTSVIPSPLHAVILAVLVLHRKHWWCEFMPCRVLKSLLFGVFYFKWMMGLLWFCAVGQGIELFCFS